MKYVLGVLMLVFMYKVIKTGAEVIDGYVTFDSTRLIQGAEVSD